MQRLKKNPQRWVDLELSHSHNSQDGQPENTMPPALDVASTQREKEPKDNHIEAFRKGKTAIIM